MFLRTEPKIELKLCSIYILHDRHVHATPGPARRPVRLLGLFRCVVYFIGHFINRHEDEEDDGGGGSGDGRGDGDCDGGDDRSRTL